MLNTLAIASLGVAVACAILIAVDEVRHPQRMWIMNIVWPATSLYFSVFALWAYFVKGRQMAKDAMQGMSQDDMHRHQEQKKKQARKNPTWTMTALSGSHCGAGCTIADIVTEFTVFGVGATFLGLELYANFLWDFIAAWSLGIVFQYFTIKPMRNLSIGEGIWAAIKADTLSIATFQIGMYGFMALVYFKLFPSPHLHVNDPKYWFMMQIAMVCGFGTALPVNWLLVKIGWKEAMG
jgi:hypothetical protein